MTDAEKTEKIQDEMWEADRKRKEEDADEFEARSIAAWLDAGSLVHRDSDRDYPYAMPLWKRDSQ